MVLNELVLSRLVPYVILNGAATKSREILCEENEKKEARHT